MLKSSPGPRGVAGSLSAHRRVRPSTLAFFVLGLGSVAFAASFLDAAILRDKRAAETAARTALTARLGLTDPALMTEATYARNLSLADPGTAFLGNPLGFDLFPSGALVAPPSHALVARPAAVPR